MEFGKVPFEKLSEITFDLPALPTHIPHSTKNTAQVYVGCPIWANKEWLGSWYPSDAKEKDFLKYYAQQFNTIELNSTHYQIPSPSTVEQWRDKVGKDFRFCPKFLQEISHQRLPKGDTKILTHAFCETMQYFGERLGMSFLQLPPYFTPKEAEMLLRFCDILPQDYRLAIEFRHEHWFVGEHLARIAEELTQRHIGIVITDTAGRRDAVHLCFSLPTLMLRFVGNDLHPTDYSRIDTWVGKLQSLLKLGVDEIYFFAHEPDNTYAPELACYFIRKLAEVCAIKVAEPTFLGSKQMGLF